MRSEIQRTILLFALFLAACAAVLFCISFENTPLEPYTVAYAEQSESSTENVSSSAVSGDIIAAEKVNLNTATAEELEQLNGIGEVLAGRIIAYREENSGFKDTRELANVKGIGDKLLEKLLPYVTV